MARPTRSELLSRLETVARELQMTVVINGVVFAKPYDVALILIGRGMMKVKQ